MVMGLDPDFGFADDWWCRRLMEVIRWLGQTDLML